MVVSHSNPCKLIATHLATYLVLRALLCSGSGSGFDSSFAIQVPKDCNVTDTQHQWPIDRHFAVHHRDCRQRKEQLYHPRHAFESTTEQPGRPPAIPNNSQTHPQSEGQPAAHVRVLVQVRVLSHGLLCWLLVSCAVLLWGPCLSFPASTWRATQAQDQVRTSMRCAASAAASHPLYREDERGAEKVFILRPEAHKVARTASPDGPWATPVSVKP